MQTQTPIDYTIPLGGAFLKTRNERVILKVGGDTWTVEQVAALGIVETRACGIVTAYAARAKVANLKQLYADTSPYELAGRYGFGRMSLYVLLRAFEDRGLNVEKWYARGQKAAVVAFLTLKARELKAEQRTRRGARRRANSLSTPKGSIHATA